MKKFSYKDSGVDSEKGDWFVHAIKGGGARPLFLLDYFAVSKRDQEKAIKVVSGIVKGCTEAECSLIGGETAEMPGFYAEGEYDLAGFAVGIVENAQLIDRSSVTVR